MARTLIWGSSGSGKSTLINMLLNSECTRESLSKPAKTGNSTNAVTTQVSVYSYGKRLLIDSIGFGHESIQDSNIIRGLSSLFIQANVGINNMLFCIKHGRLSKNDRNLLKGLKKIFSGNIYPNTVLVVTHLDDQETPLNKDGYLTFLRNQSQKDEEYIKFVDQFSHVVAGTMISFSSEKFDSPFIPIRNAMRLQVENALKNCSEEPIEFKISNFYQFALSMYHWVKNIFSKKKGDDEQTKALLQHMIKCKDSYISGEPCSICLEYATADLYITECGHVFHFDCLSTWLKHHDDCPNCRSNVVDWIKNESKENQPSKGKQDNQV